MVRFRLSSVSLSAACCLALTAMLSAVVTRAADPRANNPSKPTVPSQSTAAADAFARALFAELAGQEGNLAVSPASIEGCLLLALAGARGQTAEEIARALRLPPDQTGDLDRLLDRAGARLEPAGQGQAKPSIDLSIANSVWVQQGLPIHDAYRRLLSLNNRATFESVDFLKHTEAARKAVNAWVDKATNHKIPELLKPNTVSPDTRLVLANAIYFKARWEHPFDRGATKDAAFHSPGADDVKVPLMQSRTRYRYLETESYQTIELPYAGSQYAMVVWLPKKLDGLAALEKSFALGTTAPLTKLAPALVELSLPRFKANSSLSLAGTLSNLGMRRAFTPAADFSGIVSEPLSISAVVHQALVEVDEVGTEAAAATGAVAVTAAMPEPVQPKIFRADHPFVFAIRNRTTGDVLFLGRVANPAQ